MAPNKSHPVYSILTSTQPKVTESGSTKAALWQACSRRGGSGSPSVTQPTIAIKIKRIRATGILDFRPADLTYTLTVPFMFVLLAPEPPQEGQDIVVRSRRWHTLTGGSENPNPQPVVKSSVWKHSHLDRYGSISLSAPMVPLGVWGTSESLLTHRLFSASPSLLIAFNLHITILWEQASYLDVWFNY